MPLLGSIKLLQQEERECTVLLFSSINSLISLFHKSSSYKIVMQLAKYWPHTWMNLPKISDTLSGIRVGGRLIKHYTVQCMAASYLFPFWYSMHELTLFDESLRKMGSDKQLLFQQLCTMTASIEKHIIGSKMPHFYHLHWIRHETL